MEDQNAGNTTPKHATVVAVSEPEVLDVHDVPEAIENTGGGVVSLTANFASREGSESGVKRKRGRPKKQQVETRGELMVMPEYSATPPQKRGRGRLRGSGKWQTLGASLGGTVGDTARSDFTPYTIAIQQGENIVERIWSFSQKIPESICILSASGTISSAELYIPASRGGVIRYEGEFSISLYICLLSVQLANPDGKFYGGAVAGSLVAGGPTTLIIATFKQNLRRQPTVRPQRLETPKPNKGTVTAPPQAENSKQVADDEGKVVASASPLSADDPAPVNDQVVVKDQIVSNASSPQPVEIVSETERVMLSDVETGVATD